MKHSTIAQKPTTDETINNTSLLQFANKLHILMYWKNCKLISKVLLYSMPVSWKIFLIHTCNQSESYALLRETATWGYALMVGSELRVPFTWSSGNVQGKQNYIRVSKYGAKHTHYIYKYFNICNKNKREINMSNILTVISLAQGLASSRILAATEKHSSREFLNIIILLEQ